MSTRELGRRSIAETTTVELKNERIALGIDAGTDVISQLPSKETGRDYLPLVTEEDDLAHPPPRVDLLTRQFGPAEPFQQATEAAANTGRAPARPTATRIRATAGEQKASQRVPGVREAPLQARRLPGRARPVSRPRTVHRRCRCPCRGRLRQGVQDRGRARGGGREPRWACPLGCPDRPYPASCGALGRVLDLAGQDTQLALGPDRAVALELESYGLSALVRARGA